MLVGNSFYRLLFQKKKKKKKEKKNAGFENSLLV